MLSRFVRRNARTGQRSFSQAQQQKAPIMKMKKSKHDFVKFVNKATLQPLSEEKQELYSYLVECFVDNDTDYDGQVSYRGFNSMIAEAAVAPRRFGFAPHTREMYSSKEEYESERLKLFNQLRGGDERVSLQNWLKWADEHIKEKVGDGLQEHNENKWERSKTDYIDFLKGVLSSKDANCMKSSTSTQLKEHYMNSVRQFTTADTSMTGKLDKKQFDNLVQALQKLPGKHGLVMYNDWTFQKVAGPDKNFVTMKDFLDYKINYIKEMLPKLEKM